MPRKPRIHFPGALYHVILRGNAGEPVFFDDADRYRFYLLLQEGIERFGYRVHAFCCMTNHIHMALQVGSVSLSRIMQNLALRYTSGINRKYRRTGHLFQGRYKAILLDADSYLLELVRYIHLNPVRARLVKHPDNYSWRVIMPIWEQRNSPGLLPNGCCHFFPQISRRPGRPMMTMSLRERMSHEDPNSISDQWKGAFWGMIVLLTRPL